MTTENMPTRRRIVLTGISSRAWEHPADRGALTALRELRGFDDVLKAIAGIWNERAWRMMYLGGSIRVDHRQHPRVHRLFAEAAATLDVDELARALRRAVADHQRVSASACPSRSSWSPAAPSSCSTTRSCGTCSATNSATCAAVTPSTAR